MSGRPPADAEAAARWLRTPEAVRARAGTILAAADAGDLPHFELHMERLDAAAELVVDEIHRNYPALEIPFHSRWRHFAIGGRDRFAELAAGLDGVAAEEIARLRFDLAVVSVLLDAGAGGLWRWVDPSTGRPFARSEGLALASLDAFARGLFSSDPARPLRADSGALIRLDARALAEAFQVAEDNPLEGLEGRVALLNRLGATLADDPGHFGPDGRVGNLFDHFAGQVDRGRIETRTVLLTLLEALGPIWPGRIVLGGINLGDAGHHPAASSDDPGSTIVPFHKLSQWLAYSLIEPLQDAGFTVTGLDALTALAEYRNGGLLIDAGVLRPRDPSLLDRAHATDSEVVVEWRALTVALIDRIAERLRARLGLDAEALPLARVLEGGTWSAGRRIAREKRPDGAPPLAVLSDGTVF